MSDLAKVTSLDALAAFRASLIVFISKAHRPLDEVGDEIRRTRAWLQNDQRMHWEHEVRRRKRVLDQAAQELMSARLSGLRDSTTMQENMVRKAKEALEEAGDKLRTLKIWNRDFEHAVEPLIKTLESLRHYLDHDMPKAIAYLLQAQQTLEAYAETGAPASSAPAAETEAVEQP